ncbi:MAG: right-handed parallel beta-helix repeat-containing protein [Planctomycetes bacterium]|nr:right-handed parallel beta-helix repeat-containing protein [Planctomycetota bacterium]
MSCERMLSISGLALGIFALGPGVELEIGARALDASCPDEHALDEHAAAPNTVPRADELELVVVDRDDVRIDRSCRIAIASTPLVDDEGDGVLQIVADGVTVEFQGARLHGAPSDASFDAYEGIGVRITAKHVTLRDAIVSGFRGGIFASRADGLVLERCDVSGNRRQRLRSTERAEDGADWLWPHENDANQWLVNYGAGIYVEESRGITVRECRARRGQNGLLLRRVDDSVVVDNDFSFLSGWGLGLFRSERNVVQHNALDFCVRGYSHGVYSRGQDSAGILFFEQNRDNLIAFNSATHSGDGFFGFAGKAALEGAEVGPGVGCTGNVLYGNDFSYAPAIGIELTFSFDNQFVANRLVGSNYGVWGGYSSRTRMAANQIAENTLAGVAIEHGSAWVLEHDVFRANRRGVELWWDDDRDLLAKPWAQVNPTVSRGFTLRDASFERDQVGVELRGGTRDVVLERCRFVDVATEVLAGEQDEFTRSAAPSKFAAPPSAESLLDEHGRTLLAKLGPAKTRPVGARAQLAGRDKILMTEWGPYDWAAPYLARLADEGAAHRYRLLGDASLAAVEVAAEFAGEVDAQSLADGRLEVRARRPGCVAPYRLRVATSGGELERSGVIVDAPWRVRVFPWTVDPREDLAAWRAEAAAAREFALTTLDLPFQGGGASDVPHASEAVKALGLPRDRFGTLAETTVTIPAGPWRVRVVSDDGVRVTFDGRTVIERWDWHAPTEDVHEFELAEPATLRIGVEHFEIDGWAALSLAFEARD